jgi:hypothetical protein
MLKGAAKCAGVLAIAVAGFFAARTLTDRFDDDPVTTAPHRPKIYGVAGAPAPEPPAWPMVRKDTADVAVDQGEDGEGEATEGTPVESATTTPSEATETPPPPKENNPSPNPGGSGQEGGSSGSGIEEEVGG